MMTLSKDFPGAPRRGANIIHRRALAASRSEHAAQLEEDRQLQQATRLSMMEDGPIETESQIKDGGGRLKRKAEDDLRPVSIKQTPSVSKFTGMSTNKPSSSTPVASVPSKSTIKYPNGALRITRTPGRSATKNCVNLTDLIHKEQLISACVFSFFIGDDELFDHLPLSQTSDAVPIYIGRDANMDTLTQQACKEVGMTFAGKLSNKQLQSISPKLRQLYTKHAGKNYHAFYAWSPGSSHSKILVLVYPDFLRLVITSCNMMDIDTVMGDNHWYIHDLPTLPKRTTAKPSDFEAGFLAHLEALNTPDSFIESVRGMYDYSKVKAQLVTSSPGVCAGARAEKHGLLRLRNIVKSFDLEMHKKMPQELRLEVCAASIGNLNAKWLNGFYDCAMGKETVKIANEGCAIPDLRIVYPSMGDVRNALESSQDAASNIGCHTRPWEDAPQDIKKLFHHYESKDTGRLFHQKLIMAYNPSDAKAAPYYVYVGSANLSQSAWGALENDKKENKATCNLKLVKLSNFECGVVIRGDLVEGLLEEGTKSWQDGIVPYVQNGKKYDLAKDKPWNDARWVQDRGDYRDA